jgi:hypothetical protein
LIELFGLIGGRRFGKGWSVTLAAIAVQRELRDDQCFAAHVDDRAIHFSFLIFKYAQVCDLVGEKIGFGCSILFADSHEHAQAATDFTDDSLVYRDAGL